jgi:Rps23 Pro-64 3,4-dihydroxylase Tpa1-like proline 4-hydroxylase
MADAALQTYPDERALSYSEWLPKLDKLVEAYRSNTPFPHIVLDNFLNPEILKRAVEVFPDLKSGEWINYVHVNERKYGKTELESFPAVIRAMIQELNSDRFIQFLTQLTGIPGLFADSSLEGGGLHQSEQGGYLNIHADFLSHPHHPSWQRRVNVLIYLNPNWQESYGGHLELWDKRMRRCVHRVLPIFNRCVIFNTDADSFHGHPEPLTCPVGVTRKSIALYYFTPGDRPQAVRSTEYRARPGDGLKGLLIYGDKMLLRAYDRAKRWFGWNDKFISKLLNWMDRKFKK